MKKIINIYTLLLLLVSVSTKTWTQNNFINQGNSALKSGDYSAAKSLYQEAIDQCGEDYKANHNLAILAAHSGETELALKMLDESIHDQNRATAYYNRAIINLSLKDYESALSDLKVISNAKELQSKKLEREAQAVKTKTEEKQVLVLDKLGDQYLAEGQFEKALQNYTAAMALTKQDDYFLFKKAEVGLAQKNPFVSLKNAEAIDYDKLDPNKRLEVDLIKVLSLGKINRMLEGIDILENRLYQKKVQDERLRTLLSYYYLRLNKYDAAIRVVKGRAFEDPNVYIVAGNAALYTQENTLALKCFGEAKYLDPQSINADIGRALCYVKLNKREKAMQVIDDLAQLHPDNYRVLNTKGIVYKDVGLYYKNRQNSARAKSYLTNSVAAFLTAQNINALLKDDFENNRALALFYLNKNSESKKLWLTNNKLSSQNNLALLYASQKKYKAAYQKLDSLSDVYSSRNRKRNKIVEYNKDLARSRTRLNDNYKFITNYFLDQDKPELSLQNPFTFELGSTSGTVHSEYILEFSDADCTDNSRARRKKKKKKKFKLFKRKKKKKQKGDCPTF